jgi:hypothetical protein
VAWITNVSLPGLGWTQSCRFFWDSGDLCAHESFPSLALDHRWLSHVAVYWNHPGNQKKYTQRFWNEVLFWIFSAKDYTRKLPFCFDSGSDTRFLSFLTTLVCLGYSFTSSFYCTFYNACSIHWSSFHLLPRILLAEAKCHLFGDAPLSPQKHSWNPGIVKRKYIHHWGPILPSWDWCPVREVDRSSSCSTRGVNSYSRHLWVSQWRKVSAELSNWKR